jgi:hypothetical protein
MAGSSVPVIMVLAAGVATGAKRKVAVRTEAGNAAPGIAAVTAPSLLASVLVASPRLTLTSAGAQGGVAVGVGLGVGAGAAR